MIFIDKVEDVFKISGRHVIVPGIPCDFESCLEVGAYLEFHNPTGMIVSAQLEGFEMIRRNKPGSHIPFSIGNSAGKNEVDVGALLYLVVESKND